MACSPPQPGVLCLRPSDRQCMQPSRVPDAAAGQPLPKVRRPALRHSCAWPACCGLQPLELVLPAVDCRQLHIQRGPASAHRAAPPAFAASHSVCCFPVPLCTEHVLLVVHRSFLPGPTCRCRAPCRSASCCCFAASLASNAQPQTLNPPEPWDGTGRAGRSWPADAAPDSVSGNSHSTPAAAAAAVGVEVDGGSSASVGWVCP
ncbi:hypothetical protein COO60DRAFT_748598 [Scenedesmus sp. NREL 46B-D3]|nr:hypothetical protein COO60DRAFT_748598 [Scenedesmus sp. NREL 46B-D3]